MKGHCTTHFLRKRTWRWSKAGAAWGGALPAHCTQMYPTQCAMKRVTHVRKHVQKPRGAQGIKLELFIFDSFPLAERCALLEVRREDEFAPVKNAPGAAADSPDTARAATLALHTRCALARMPACSNRRDTGAWSASQHADTCLSSALLLPRLTAR